MLSDVLRFCRSILLSTAAFIIYRVKFLVPMLGVLLAGCSISPLQQDVTGVPTENLVQYIRCETRLAIQDKAILLVANEKPVRPIAETMRALRGQPWPSNLRTSLNAQERFIYDKYIETGIAYDFSFDITVDNSGSGIADPIRLITNGTAGVGLSASGDYKRQNLRHFIVSDTAKNLLESDRLNCGPDYRASNYAYPISGDIGLQELISTFFELNEVKSLAVLDKDRPTTVFVDTLTFTTTLMGSASPHVIVAPIGNNLGLAAPGANVTGAASRIDKHALIIALSLDKPKGRSIASAPAVAAVVPGYSARSALQKDSVRSLTEQSALDALGQARLDAYLDRATR